ncbi:MAG TPA: hypothetical protein VK091_01485 [Virgibacillus sp.]|nr:hypothetical protein [Virgibacillus sp.]
MGKATRLFGGMSSAQSQSQLKIPQEVVFASEEAEALPAESDCPERKSTCSFFALYINYEIKSDIFFGGASKRSPSPKTYKKALFKTV